MGFKGKAFSAEENELSVNSRKSDENKNMV